MAAVTPALLHAQYEGQFQTPTPEELKMTADPKAPGAAAVYLNVEEVTNDPRHYAIVYARIKVLTEKGKTLATVDVPFVRKSHFNPTDREFFNSVTDITGRTIHSDGTIVPLEYKPEDQLISKKGEFERDRVTFTLPSVEVGSIIEYRYQVQNDDKSYSSPNWRIQKDYFVHKAHYAFTPFENYQPNKSYGSRRYLIDSKGRAINALIWESILPPGVAVKTEASGSYTLDLTDIPATPQEAWMPPMKSFLWHLSFYYSYANDSGDYWTSEAKDWSKDVDHFAEATGPIREAVKGLIAPGDSDLDKAKKLYTAVQALDNTNFSRQKEKSELKELGEKQAKRAEDTWAQKSGSAKDITRLYLAMLRAAGLTAYDMKVVDRSRGIFNPGYLNFGQLDDDVIILSTGGKDIYLDPGEKMCPFQTMHWRHTGASGVRQSAQGRPVASTPLQTYADNTLVRIGDVTLDDHGGATGNIRFGMTGQSALYWRQEALRNDLDEVKKRFDRDLETLVPEGIEAHVDHFVAIDNPDAQLIAVIKVQGALGTATAKRLMIPGFFFESRGRHPFVDEEKRQELVDMHYGDKVTDQVTYHLPAGLTVEGAPQDGNISWPDHAVLVAKTVSAPSQVTIARIFAHNFTFAKADEYQDLRGFYQKVASSDQQQLILTTAPAVKGN